MELNFFITIEPRYFCVDYIALIKNNRVMNNNSLASIVFEKSLQRQSSKKLALKINSKIQFPQSMDSMGQSNKLIKITQFNSSLLINQDKLTQKGYKTSYSSSPQKNFTVKKVNQLKSKAVINTQKIIEIELKRRQKYKAHKQSEKKIGDDIATKQQIQKIMISNKWSPNKESFNYELLMMNSLPQTVAIFRPVERKPSNQDKSISGKQLTDNILLGRSKDIQPKELIGKISSSKEKIRPQLKSEIKFNNIESEQITRKLSTSPRKNYSRHFEEQKKYQENIEKQKRQILQMKRQLNKNYAKPFNPPQKITAFSYIIYEADIKKHKKLRKYSARRYDVQQVMEIKKMFLHSHQVIVSLNSRTAVQMASLTKIMTCMIALDLSKKFNIDLSTEKVKIGLFEQNICGTSANIKKGEIYSIEQLLYGLMLPSGNDASLAIAIWGGKILYERIGKRQIQSPISTNQMNTQSTREEKVRIKFKKRQYYERFISEMNFKANQLNMQKTKYSNSHGLSNPQNRSCAFDLAILSEYAMNNQHFRRIVCSKVYQTQITIQSNLITPKQGPISAKQSRRSLKKRVNIPIANELYQQTQQINDMNELYEDKFPEQQQGITSQSQQYQTKMVRWQNTHHLVQTKSDLYVGIKTGVTTTAGPCLSSCIQIKGRRFIIIVLNCKNMKYRMKDTQNLRKWLFNKQSMRYIEQVSEKPFLEDDKDD